MVTGHPDVTVKHRSLSRTTFAWVYSHVLGHVSRCYIIPCQQSVSLCPTFGCLASCHTLSSSSERLNGFSLAIHLLARFPKSHVHDCCQSSAPPHPRRCGLLGSSSLSELYHHHFRFYRTLTDVCSVQHYVWTQHRVQAEGSQPGWRLRRHPSGMLCIECARHAGT